MPTKSTSSGAHRRDFLQGLGAGIAGLALARKTTAAPEKSGAKPLHGVFPIGQTPYTPAGKLDLDGLAAEVQFCNQGKVHGFAWPQIFSGWSNLSEQERLSGAEAILGAGKGGRTTLVIGVQTKDGSIAGAIQYAKHAEKNGADAIISLPPPGVTDDNALVSYYRQLGAATALPLFVQSIGDMSVDLILRMFKEIPTMRVVKDEAGDPLTRVQELREKSDGKLNVFSGKGVRTMITEMELGFSGHCPTPALGDVYAAAYDLYHEGKHNEAFDMFGRILAFDSIPGPQDDVLTLRHVFKENTHFRPLSMGGGGGKGGQRRPAFPPELGKKMLSEALSTYMKPYLRA